jgi:hypothetical protein
MASEIWAPHFRRIHHAFVPMPPGFRCSIESKTHPIDDPPTWSQSRTLGDPFSSRSIGAWKAALFILLTRRL